MDNKEQSPLYQWLDNAGSTGSREAIDLLSALVVGMAFTSGVLSDNEDLQANYMQLIKTVFGGLYDSGEAENFSEEVLSSVYTHLTGEDFTLLQAQWEDDMSLAIAQNQAFLTDYEDGLHPVDCTCEECAEVLRSAGYELIDDEVLYSAEYDWADDDDEDTGLHQCLCEDNVGRLGKCEYCGGQIIPF